MPRGPRVEQDIEAACMRAALEDREAPAKEIREKVREWLELLGRPTPGLRKVQQLVSLARRGARNNQHDEPWSLAAMDAEGIASEAVPYLLDCLKDIGRHLTNRMARWLWRIHLAAPELDVYDACDEASRYADRELVTQHFGLPFLTEDLDARIAYKPWRSEEAMQTYVNAIERGYIPVPESMIKRLSRALMMSPMMRGRKPPLNFEALCQGLVVAMVGKDHPDWRACGLLQSQLLRLFIGKGFRWMLRQYLCGNCESGVQREVTNARPHQATK